MFPLPVLSHHFSVAKPVRFCGCGGVCVAQNQCIDISNSVLVFSNTLHMHATCIPHAWKLLCEVHVHTLTCTNKSMST